jgi:hypothetical protein
MPHISQVDYAKASPEQRAAHDEELRLRGRMTNMKRTLLHSPAALRIYGEWFTLRDELRPVIGDRAIWLFALSISKASHSLVGTGFMRRALIQSGVDPDALDPNEADGDLMRFGEAIGADPNSVSVETWQPLQTRYAEKTLVDLVAFAGIMVATNVFTNVVGTGLDAELAEFAARS